MTEKKNPVLNPYLPLWEYVPDGEPRVFGERLYLYGSHDFAGGEKGFCPGDYMAWSAPLADLSDWRCDGVLFPRSACPGLTDTDAMAAPDVVRGPDGRYYLYFNTNDQKVCRVAVSDGPSGPFTYYADVCSPDGSAYSDYKMFDPGVLVDDDGRVYLFTGFCMPGPVPEQYRGLKSPFAETSLGFELAPDMKTILAGPVPILPGGNRTEGTGFEGHGFYEASSPRKLRGKYVMVYSGETSHELAYALADAPLGPYCYAGVLVSNGDLGLNGNTRPVMPYGNTHGGLVELEDGWYVFYHRQTHAIECCRQGCAQKLPIRPDGWFGMAEITSCGLNRGPLAARGSYPAGCCCHLTSPEISPERLNVRQCRRSTEPHIYEESETLHYIARIGAGTTVGFKYFQWEAPDCLMLTLRGMGPVCVELRLDAPEGPAIGQTREQLTGGWQELAVPLSAVTGVHSLYICFREAQNVQFRTVAFPET